MRVEVQNTCTCYHCGAINILKWLIADKILQTISKKALLHFLEGLYTGIAFERPPVRNQQVPEGDLIIQFLLFNYNFHGCLFISC